MATTYRDNGRTLFSGTEAERLAYTIQTSDTYEKNVFWLEPNGNEYRVIEGGWVKTKSAGAELTSLETQLAGERNPGTVNQYAVGVDECNGSILDAVTTAQAVSGGVPALIFGVQINTALAGTLIITGLANVSGAPTDIVLPIATPIGYYEMKGAKCNTALICTLSDATDDVLVLWRGQ